MYKRQVVHCAAWTAVDLAEDDDKKAKVHAINADGTQNIADACKKIDAKTVSYTHLDVYKRQIRRSAVSAGVFRHLPSSHRLEHLRK